MNLSKIEEYEIAEQFTLKISNKIFNQIVNQQYESQPEGKYIRINLSLVDENFTLNDYVLKISDILDLDDFHDMIIQQIKKKLEPENFTLITPFTYRLFVVLFGIIIVLGLFANATIVYTFYDCQKLRTFRNVFIINLAICDMFLCMFYGPLTLIKYSSLNWIYGSLLCKLSYSLPMASVLVSVYSMATIAVDRWQFIVHSGRDRAQKYCLIMLILSIWLVISLISLPLFVVSDEKIIRIEPNTDLFRVCDQFWPNLCLRLVYNFCILFLQFLVPGVIVCFTNYQICRFLHFRMPIIHTNSFQSKSRSVSYSIDILGGLRNPKKALLNLKKGDGSYLTSRIVLRHNKRYTRSRRILALVFLGFSICWLPSFSYNVLLDLYKNLMNGREIAITMLTFHLISISSACLNPILYGLLNKNFNNELSRIISTKFSSLTQKTSNSNLVQSDRNQSTKKNNQNNSNSKNSLILHNS